MVSLKLDLPFFILSPHPHEESASSYSEPPSDDVHPNILGSATDTAQASKRGINKYRKYNKKSQKQYLNADFQINYNKGFMGVVIGLRQLLKLRYKGEVTMLNI